MPAIRRTRHRPTTNQLIVAEALSIARLYGFREGLTFLKISHQGAKDLAALSTWFKQKCKEHGIPVPARAS